MNGGLLLMLDEVPASWGRCGEWLCIEHGDVVTIGKGFGHGFPVNRVAMREPHKKSFEAISA